MDDYITALEFPKQTVKFGQPTWNYPWNLLIYLVRSWHSLEIIQIHNSAILKIIQMYKSAILENILIYISIILEIIKTYKSAILKNIQIYIGNENFNCSNQPDPVPASAPPIMWSISEKS